MVVGRKCSRQYNDDVRQKLCDFAETETILPYLRSIEWTKGISKHQMQALDAKYEGWSIRFSER